MSVDNIHYEAILNKFVMIFWIAILSSCTFVNDKYITKVTEPPKVTIVTYTYGSYVGSFSYPQLADRSDLVIIGRPVAVGETINMAQDSSDLSRSDSDLYGIGQVYLVEVEQYLKGSGDEIIQVVQYQGDMDIESGTPTTAEIERVIAADKHIPLSLDTRYLMFLGPTFIGVEKPYHSGISHPWRFVISEDNCIYIEDILGNLSKYFPLQPLENVLKELEKPYERPANLQGGGLPYPPPVEENRCSSPPASGPYPYP